MANKPVSQFPPHGTPKGTDRIFVSEDIGGGLFQSKHLTLDQLGAARGGVDYLGTFAVAGGVCNVEGVLTGYSFYRLFGRRFWTSGSTASQFPMFRFMVGPNAVGGANYAWYAMGGESYNNNLAHLSSANDSGVQTTRGIGPSGSKGTSSSLEAFISGIESNEFRAQVSGTWTPGTPNAGNAGIIVFGGGYDTLATVFDGIQLLIGGASSWEVDGEIEAYGYRNY